MKGGGEKEGGRGGKEFRLAKCWEDYIIVSLPGAQYGRSNGLPSLLLQHQQGYKAEKTRQSALVRHKAPQSIRAVQWRGVADPGSLRRNGANSFPNHDETVRRCGHSFAYKSSAFVCLQVSWHTLHGEYPPCRIHFAVLAWPPEYPRARSTKVRRWIKLTWQTPGLPVQTRSRLLLQGHLFFISPPAEVEGMALVETTLSMLEVRTETNINQNVCTTPLSKGKVAELKTLYFLEREKYRRRVLFLLC